MRAFNKSNIVSETVVVSDGQEALDYLFVAGAYAGRDPMVMPHMVLLDVNLPKINGLEVLRRMRADERTRRLPVVILTNSREESDIICGYDLGANSYVRKPVDFAKFAGAALQLRLYRLGLNEPPPVREKKT